MARAENRVEVIVGNPPWLAYRHMTSEMQQAFRLLSEERGLWAGASVATNQDLSTLFALRAIERYLVPRGQFGFVMPWAVLRGRQYAGFRRGRYELRDHVSVAIHFQRPWDMHAVKPSFFPVPACVILGTRSSDDKPTALQEAVVTWAGRLPKPNLDWEEAAPHIKQDEGKVERAMAFVASTGSPYQVRFSQGATLVPRMLFLVEEKVAGPLGSGAGRIAVPSKKLDRERQRTVTSKLILRSAGCIAGATMGIGANLLGLDAMLWWAVLLAGVWIGQRLQDGPARTSYFGTQFCLGFQTAYVQDVHEPTSNAAAVERFLDIASGCVTLWILMTFSRLLFDRREG